VNAIVLGLEQHAEELLEIHDPKAARARQLERQRASNPGLVRDRFRAFARDRNIAAAAKKAKRLKSVRVKVPSKDKE